MIKAVNILSYQSFIQTHPDELAEVAGAAESA